MLFAMFKNVNALSMFVMITVLGISIYTILTYKSLLLFEKDMYRTRAQLSSLSAAVQDLMQKERERDCAKQAFGFVQKDSHLTHQAKKECDGGLENRVDAGQCGVSTPSVHLKPGDEVEKQDGDENDEDVSLEEIAKLKNLVANIKSDDEGDDEGDDDKVDKGNDEDDMNAKDKEEEEEEEKDEEEDLTEDGEISLCQEVITEAVNEEKECALKKNEEEKQEQEQGIENFIQGHSTSNPNGFSFVQPQELQKMKYEELRQYLRSHFGISQSRGTKADLISKINQQIGNAIV